MAADVIIPAVANVHFLDLLNEFEVCTSIEIKFPIGGGIRPKRLCVRAGNLAEAFLLIARAWGSVAPASPNRNLAYDPGDVAVLADEFTYLRTLSPAFQSSPAPPDMNIGPDEGVIVYVGDYGVTPPPGP